jgi:hypothetical protein
METRTTGNRDERGCELLDEGALDAPDFRLSNEAH